MKITFLVPFMNTQKLEKHLFSYRFNGRDYAFEIPAQSAEEAKERLKSLAWAQYDGVLVARIPAQLGLLGRIVVAIRNAAKTALPNR